jgi:hypothetical protein
MNNPLGNILDIVPGVVPVDLHGSAHSGDFVSLKGAQGLLVVFFKGIGTAAQDPVLELQQATVVAGTDAKDLNGFVDIFKKQGTLSGVGTWTKVSQTADEDFTGDGTSAESEGLYVAWIPATLLDRANGFDCVQVNVKDVGANAQLGCVLYILCGLRYQRAPEDALSAIVD